MTPNVKMGYEIASHPLPGFGIYLLPHVIYCIDLQVQCPLVKAGGLLNCTLQDEPLLCGRHYTGWRTKRRYSPCAPPRGVCSVADLFACLLWAVLGRQHCLLLGFKLPSAALPCLNEG
jgi:hypothetical protein